MAPHLSEKELDDIQKWKDLPTSDIMERLGRARGRRGVEVPGLRVVQRASKGDTFRRGVVEKRGRKKKLSTKNVKKMNVLQTNRRQSLRKRPHLRKSAKRMSVLQPNRKQPLLRKNVKKLNVLQLLRKRPLLRKSTKRLSVLRPRPWRKKELKT